MRARADVRSSKTVGQSYDWEPSAALAAAVSVGVPTAAGVEAAVWCETVTSGDDLEFLLLPRLAGVAERAWSPQGVGHLGRIPRAAQSTAWTRRGWTWFRSSDLARAVQHQRNLTNAAERM
ncbi:family 20 glycosylhydrolase [Plantactinospora solaniradicis]|uniref:Family 20 glycosylhydrolase n=1 Tax=Plantactinospora solaniradicis TaxID=1723736 RepID=A0ABW1KKX7_9ACTN